MRGAVAAGHPLTAEAGAAVLRAGGNAVDACIAAAAVSWVCESPLTGPGGGGFLLVHRVRAAETRLLDFFVSLPRRPGPPQELLELEVDFGDSQQRFRTGPAAVAVPGVVPGLWHAHQRFGSLPWADLLAPAARLARTGVVLDESRAYLHRILDPLLRHSPEGDALYGPGRPLRAGERFTAPELGKTIERLAVDGPGHLSSGEVAERIAAHVPISREDLACYEVVEREPLRLRYRDCELCTNPPPARRGGRSPARCRPRRPRRTRARYARARRTSASSTGTGTRPRSRARSARAAASSSPAPASTSTTCSARFTWPARRPRRRAGAERGLRR